MRRLAGAGTRAIACAALGLSIALAGCAAREAGEPGAVPDTPANFRPAAETSEAGLWMMMDKAERDVATSGRTVADPALRSYLRDVLCRLSAEYCNDVRFQIVRNAHFNANMAPNGFMQVWTGALLRFDNEAQTAFVFGHELAHYRRRHSIQRWESVRDTTNALSFFSVLTAGVGIGFVGGFAQLAALGGVMAYSRDHEREADKLGLRLMVAAGYDPREAHKVWANLAAEKAADEDADGPSLFLASHPAPEERLATLRALADRAVRSGARVTIEAAPYKTMMRRFLSDWLSDELKRNAPAESEQMLGRKIEAADPVELASYRFAMGELYRRRAGDGDADRAIYQYEAALESGGAPVETWRALGLVHLQHGARDLGKSHLRRYLALAPAATDRAMIEHMLSTD